MGTRNIEKLGHEVIIFYNVRKSDSRAGKVCTITDKVKKVYLVANNFGHHALLNMDQLDKYEIDLMHIQGDNLLKVPEAKKQESYSEYLRIF